MFAQQWSLVKRSLTITWAWALGLFGLLLELVPLFLDLVGLPEVSEGIRGLLPAEWLGLYSMVIAIVTYFVRMRTLRDI